MKRKIVVIVAIIAALIGVGTKCIYPLVREKNVFDQMYYTRVHTDFKWWSPVSFRGKFHNMEQLEGISDDEEKGSIYFEGIFHERYKSEYLPENTTIEIGFLIRSKEVTISYLVFEDELYDYSKYRNYDYTYNVEEKTLTYLTNDPEDPDNNKDYLYDIFLKNWFAANPHTRFDIDHLGKYTFIDESKGDR